MKFVKPVSIVTSLVAASAILAGASQVAAAASTLSVSPASGSITQGSSKTISIIETGDNVNAVTVHLNYDASKLSCNGIGGGSFGAEVTASCGGGTVTISRYVPAGSPALSGSQVVGTVNFGALAGSGSTSVSFGSSQVASNGTNTLGSTSGGTYTLVAPTSGGQGGGSGSTGSSGVSDSSRAAGVAASSAAANGSTTNSSQTHTAASTNGATNPQAQAEAAADHNGSKSHNTNGVNGVSTVTNSAAKTAGYWVVVLALLGAIGAAGYFIYRHYNQHKGGKPKAATAVVALQVSKVKSLVMKKKPAKKTAQKTAKKPVNKKS